MAHSLFKMMKSVTVTWYPMHPKNACARSFLDMAELPLIGELYPEMVVKEKMVSKPTTPTIEIEWNDGNKRTIDASTLHLGDLMREIKTEQELLEIHNTKKEYAELPDEDMIQFLHTPEKKDKPGQEKKSSRIGGRRTNFREKKE